MNEIVTQKGQTILMDDEDFSWISKYSWQINHRGYVSRSFYVNGKQKKALMHRDILGILPGDPRIVDHINGIKTDNRRSNLRICSKSENGYNQGMQRHNTTGFKGVTFHKQAGRFMAQIRSNGKKYHLGLHATAEEAYAAYCKAAKELHGEFANFGSVALLAASMGGDRS